MMIRREMLLTLLASAGLGCRQATADRAASPEVAEPAPQEFRIRSWRFVDDLPQEIAQFETVFWDPRDSESLRRWLREHVAEVAGAEILEIGVGTGLISLCCLQQGAARVTGTDINPAALANAVYNAELLGCRDRFDPRLTPMNDASAYPALAPGERFDLIVSNPPWEDAPPRQPADYAYFDSGFRLLDSLLAELPSRLRPGGKALLAYGHRAAIERLRELADKYDLEVTPWDDRVLEDLPRDFLPGMLLQVRPRRRVAPPAKA